jgi:hypothetical protein
MPTTRTTNIEENRPPHDPDDVRPQCEPIDGERAATCYTCHRGSAKPVSIPMVDSTAPYVSEARLATDPAATVETDLPSADDVIGKYIQAVVTGFAR